MKYVFLTFSQYGGDVTFCFTVTNTGDSYLDSITINDDKLDFSQTLTGVLAPSESIVVTYPSQIRGDLRNVGTVTAVPVSITGEKVGLDDVEDSDDSTVGQFDYVGGISIDNTVSSGM